MRTRSAQAFILLLLLLISIFPLGAQHERRESAPRQGRAKSSSAGSQIVSRLRFRTLDFHVPEVGKEVKRVELENGMVLFFMEDHLIPLITIDMWIRTGSIYEKRDEHGVARLTGMVMRNGGTATLSPEQVNREIESIGAFLETSIREENGSAFLSVLSRYVDRGLRIFAEILTKPAFDKDQLELARSQVRESIRRKNENPEMISQRETKKVIYGDHPYGWELEWPVVKKISRDQVVSWHQRFFHPNNCLVAVCGDFKTEEMIARIREAFAGWEKVKMDLPPVTEVREKATPGIFVADRMLTQTYIRMGHLGIKRGNPDHYAIEIMNYILGGGSFRSRMTEKVRSDEGLSYSVHTSFPTDKRDLGLFSASSSTKVESTRRAVDLMIGEIKRIRESPVSKEELDWAKDSFINSFLFGFSIPGEIVGRLMELEYDGMPADYYKTYLSKIRSVTREDVLRVAKKYLHPENLSIILVGEEKKIAPLIEGIGKIEKLNIEADIRE